MPLMCWHGGHNSKGSRRNPQPPSSLTQRSQPRAGPPVERPLCSPARQRVGRFQPVGWSTNSRDTASKAQRLQGGWARESAVGKGSAARREPRRAQRGRHDQRRLGAYQKRLGVGSRPTQHPLHAPLLDPVTWSAVFQVLAAPQVLPVGYSLSVLPHLWFAALGRPPSTPRLRCGLACSRAKSSCRQLSER